MRDILQKTSKSIDQVTVQPDGKWELHVKPESARASKMSNDNGVTSDSDDDLVEITKSGDTVLMGAPKPGPGSSFNAVPRSVSREQSTSSGPARSISTINGKRPAAVIDLTSSGDEDDEPPVRAPKRQQTTVNNYTPPAMPAYRSPAPYSNGYLPPRN